MKHCSVYCYINYYLYPGPVIYVNNTIIMKSFCSNYFLFGTEWSGGGGNGEYRVRRQLSVSSDSKLLDEGAREEARVVMRPKRPPRPKSEAFLGPHDHSNRRTKRFSAFGVSNNVEILIIIFSKQQIS